MINGNSDCNRSTRFFANYTLIGTQWGASIEPTPGEFWRGAVPDFLSNTTMETYLQTDTIEINQQGEMTSGPGSCIGCHFLWNPWPGRPEGRTSHELRLQFSAGTCRETLR